MLVCNGILLGQSGVFETESCRGKSKRNVKCTLVQALRLCTGSTVHRGSRGIALMYRH